MPTSVCRSWPSMPCRESHLRCWCLSRKCKGKLAFIAQVEVPRLQGLREGSNVGEGWLLLGLPGLVSTPLRPGRVVGMGADGSKGAGGSSHSCPSLWSACALHMVVRSRWADGKYLGVARASACERWRSSTKSTLVIRLSDLLPEQR